MHLAIDNDRSHTSRRVKEYLEGSGGRLRLHPLAGMETTEQPCRALVWWGLHEAVSRNHSCEGLDELVEFAERYLKERQPFHLKLGADYEQMERTLP